jgi:hypothetical protein
MLIQKAQHKFQDQRLTLLFLRAIETFPREMREPGRLFFAEHRAAYKVLEETEEKALAALFPGDEETI